ncbi:MAG: SDR family oxidoreductase [Gammaproteobacteria bacterium]|nr:SDR family oxidoreductase [Gammaproteobacteria bacterium]
MNKQALVTGASSGIGLATAKLLLNKGLGVTGISRRGQVAELSDENFTAITLDLADSVETDKQLKLILKRQPFDYFIHAAGYGEFGSIEQFSVAQIERAIQVNLTSALILCRQLIPAFRQRQSGRLIFVGSESSLTAGRKGAVYSAAKFGLRGFCQALRDDCASDGIQVSLINPGMVRSPFFNELSFAPAEQPENAISTDQVAALIGHILDSEDNIVFDEVQLSPRVKSINFSAQKTKLPKA